MIVMLSNLTSQSGAKLWISATLNRISNILIKSSISSLDWKFFRLPHKPSSTQVWLRKNSKRISFLVLILSVLQNCAISNVGKVDMRRGLSDPSGATIELTAKNFSLGNNTQIVKGDSIRVRLRSAFVRNFADPPSLIPTRFLEINGEIAIVANVFETSTGSELGFTDTQSGRLVYYSDDVSIGQVLNFNNLPIYGPKTYSGQPLAFRINIFELDSGAEQAKTLLSALADAGSKAFAPAAPELKILNGIGQSLFDGSQNDNMFEYEMQLDPLAGHNMINSFLLESGYYVFIRTENRDQIIDWEKIRLNDNTGTLEYCENEEILAATVTGISQIRGSANISGRTVVSGSAALSGEGSVIGVIENEGTAASPTGGAPAIQLAGETTVTGTANVSSAQPAELTGEAGLSGTVELTGTASIGYPTACPPYTEGSYIVVEVNTGGSAQEIDLAQNTYTQLLEALESADNAAASRIGEAITALTPQVDQVIQNRNQSSNFNAAKEFLAVLSNRELTQLAKMEAAERLFTLLISSIGVNGETITSIDPATPSKTPALKDFQIDFVISSLRKILNEPEGTISTQSYNALSRAAIGATVLGSAEFGALIDLFASL